MIQDLICYLCHAIMMNQVIKTDDLFTNCCIRWPQLKTDRLVFDNAIQKCNDTGVFTGMSNGYVYQTTSVLKSQKGLDEILSIVGIKSQQQQQIQGHTS